MTASGSDRLKGLALPVAAFALMEAWLRTSAIASDSLAPPSAVFAALLRALADGSMLAATLQTLIGAFGGFLIGVAGGVVAGVALGLLRPLDRLAEVSIEAVRPIPSVALLPIALMMFGFGYGMEFAIVGFACIFTVLILTRAAILGVEPRLLEVARMLRLSPQATVRKIVIPAALPRIFVAVRLAAGIALIVSVTVEITMNPLGLGHALMTAQQALRPDLMIAYIVWIGIVGFSLNAGLLLAQRHLFGRAAITEAER